MKQAHDDRVPKHYESHPKGNVFCKNSSKNCSMNLDLDHYKGDVYYKRVPNNYSKNQSNVWKYSIGL